MIEIEKEVNTKHHKFFINHIENRFCLTSWFPNMSCAHVHIITQSYLMYNNPLFIHLRSCSDYVHMLQEPNSHVATVAPNIASALVIDMYLPPYYCGLNNIVHASTAFMHILLSADQLIVKSRYIMYQSNLSIIFIFPCNHYGSNHSLILLRHLTYIHNTQENTTRSGE